MVLVFVDPRLAASAGFALSVLATAGILVLAPGWRDALAAGCPRWLAEAISVPAAAQLACTPVVAAISGQVSLVAVAANLLVAPAVGPATVLGLAGGLAGLVSDTAGRLVGTGAGWCVAWIVLVAEHGAGLPTPAVGWGTGPLALAGLTVLVVLIAVLAPRLLGRRPPGSPAACCSSWPCWCGRRRSAGRPTAGCSSPATSGRATRWRCGPAPGAAVVVDAGPDPSAVSTSASTGSTSRSCRCWC